MRSFYHSNDLVASNLSHVPCKFFKQGTCTAGANCIFSHNPDPNSESSVCKYFRKGNCKFGIRCALLHTMSPYSTSTETSSKQTRFLFDQSSAPSPSPFSSRLLDESIFTSSMNNSYQEDFMLPSSLNDLLTPNELRQQHTNSRQYYTSNSFEYHYFSAHSHDEEGPFIMDDACIESTFNFTK